MPLFGKGKKKASKKKTKTKKVDFNEKEFEIFLNETVNDEKQKKFIRKLTVDKKSQMMKQWKLDQKKNRMKEGDIKEKPQYFIMELTTFTTSAKTEMEKATIMQNLYINLRSKQLSWVKEFTRLKGFQKLFHVFVTYNAKIGRKTPYEKDVIKNCVLSTVQLIDSLKEGFTEFVGTPNAVREFAHALSSDDSEVRWKVLYMLTAVAIKSDDLFDLVLDAMQNVKLIRRDKYTFEIIVQRLKIDTKYENKLYCLTFLNVMIAKPKSVMVKYRILGDLELMGIEKIISTLEADLISVLKKLDSKNPLNQIITSINNQISLLRDAMKSYRANKDNVQTHSGDIHTAFDRLLLRVGDNSGRKQYVNLLLNNVGSRMEKDDINDSQWEELIECAAGKMSMIQLKDRNRKLQSTLSAMKLQYDSDRIKYSKERINFVKERVGVMKYLKELQDTITQPSTPRYDPQTQTPMVKKMFEIVTNVKKKGTSSSSQSIETSILKQKLEDAKTVASEAEGKIKVAEEQANRFKAICARLKVAIDAIKKNGGKIEEGTEIPDIKLDISDEELEKLSKIKITGEIKIDDVKIDADKKTEEVKIEEKKPEEDKPEDKTEDKTEDAADPEDDDVVDDDDDDLPPPPGMGDSDDDDMPPPPDMEEDTFDPPKLPDRKPTKKMKVFHWDMVRDDDLENSIWVQQELAEGTKDIEIEREKIEELFQAIQRKGKGGGLKEEKKEKQEKICLLSGKRQQNLSIFVSRLRMNNDVLVNHIYSMNDEALNQNFLTGLIRSAPSPEEIQAERQFEGDTNLLDISDKFVRAVMIIPRFVPRLECWQFKNKFFEEISNIQPCMDIVLDGCKALSESEHWKKLLKIILSVGNYINGANKRKIAYGFKIKSLDKLTTMKSGDRKHSLMSYIVSYIDEKFNDVHNFTNDLVKIEQANRVDIKGMGDEISKLEKKRDQIKNEIKALSTKKVKKKVKKTRKKKVKKKVKKDPPPEDGSDPYEEKVVEITEEYFKEDEVEEDVKPNGNDKFVPKMKEFLVTCNKVIEDLKEKHDEMNNELSSLAEQYGENKITFPKDPSEFFERLVKFAERYKMEVRKLSKRKEKESRKLKREKARKERQSRKLKGFNTKGDGMLSGMSDALFSGKLIKKQNRFSGRRMMPGMGRMGNPMAQELSNVLMARKLKSSAPNFPKRSGNSPVKLPAMPRIPKKSGRRTIDMDM